MLDGWIVLKKQKQLLPDYGGSAGVLRARPGTLIVVAGKGSWSIVRQWPLLRDDILNTISNNNHRNEPHEPKI
jgi:hypothetical protein